MKTYIYLVIHFLLFQKCLCIEHYFLKWFKNETKFPLVFSQQTQQPGHLYDWYKHYEKVNVDRLVDTGYYKIERNTMKILSYDFTTQDQLDHYKLRLKQQTNDADEDSFLFTTAYLKDFYISIQEGRNHLNASCVAKVSIPLGVNDDHNEWLKHQLNTNVDLYFDIIDPNSVDQRKRRSNKRVVKKRATFNRMLMNIVFDAMPISMHRTSANAYYDNLKCKLTLTSFDNSVITESIYKYFEQPTTTNFRVVKPNKVQKNSCQRNRAAIFFVIFFVFLNLSLS